MPTKANRAIGSLDFSDAERKMLAIKSRSWRCENCGLIRNLLRQPDNTQSMGVCGGGLNDDKSHYKDAKVCEPSTDIKHNSNESRMVESESSSDSIIPSQSTICSPIDDQQDAVRPPNSPSGAADYPTSHDRDQALSNHSSLLLKSILVVLLLLLLRRIIIMTFV